MLWVTFLNSKPLRRRDVSSGFETWEMPKHNVFGCLAVLLVDFLPDFLGIPVPLDFTCNKLGKELVFNQYLENVITTEDCECIPKSCKQILF